MPRCGSQGETQKACGCFAAVLRLIFFFFFLSVASLPLAHVTLYRHMSSFCPLVVNDKDLMTFDATCSGNFITPDDAFCSICTAGPIPLIPLFKWFFISAGVEVCQALARVLGYPVLIQRPSPRQFLGRPCVTHPRFSRGCHAPLLLHLWTVTLPGDGGGRSQS